MSMGDLDQPTSNITLEMTVSESVVTEQMVQKAVVGLVSALGIVPSIPLLILPIFPITRRPVFVALSSWALASIFFLCVLCSNMMLATSTWAAGSFWCKTSHYLLNSLWFTRIYLLGLYAVIAALGEDFWHQCSKTRPWMYIILPLAMTSSLWILIFLPNIKLFEEAQMISFLDGKKYACIIMHTSDVKIVLMVFRFFIPMLLLFAVLILWGLCRHRRKTSARDTPPMVILFLLVPVYLVTHLAYEILMQFPLDQSKAVWDKDDILYHKIGGYVYLSEYIISPVACVILLAVYRHKLRPGGGS